MKIGQAFGIGIHIHWSFWLMPLFILASTWDSRGPAEAMVSVGVVLALFGCVALHELGHALAARYYGIGTRDITLYPIGGVARLDRISERPVEELVIALAGPAVNVAIAAFIALGMLAVNWPLVPNFNTFPLPETFINRMLWLNVGLVVFNMLPAFPMDGGRVFRSVLAMITSRLTATRVAVWTGGVIVVLFILVGVGLPLWLGEPISPILPILGVFLFLLGQQELHHVKMAEARKAERMRQEEAFGAFADGPELPSFAVPTDPHYTGHTFYPERRLWIEWRDGVPVRVSFWRDERD